MAKSAIVYLSLAMVVCLNSCDNQQKVQPSNSDPVRVADNITHWHGAYMTFLNENPDYHGPEELPTRMYVLNENGKITIRSFKKGMYFSKREIVFWEPYFDSTYKFGVDEYQFEQLSQDTISITSGDTKVVFGPPSEKPIKSDSSLSDQSFVYKQLEFNKGPYKGYVLKFDIFSQLEIISPSGIVHNGYWEIEKSQDYTYLSIGYPWEKLFYNLNVNDSIISLSL